MEELAGGLTFVRVYLDNVVVFFCSLAENVECIQQC